MDKNLEFTTKPVLSLHCGYRRCQAGLGACTLQSVASTQLGGGEMNLTIEVTLARILSTSEYFYLPSITVMEL